MGLDTSHDCWHGPYSSFTRFRNKLAQAAGYEMKPEAYENGITFDTAQIDWRGIEQANPSCYMGEWITPPNDPLIALIAHSDCDGVIHPAQAGPLADRLTELLPRLPSDDREFDAMRRKTEQFIAGLRKAVEAGEDVDFH